MPEAGFFAQQRRSPSSLALVVALHAAVLGALILAKGPQIIRELHPRTTITFIEPNPDPPPVPPPPRPDPQRPESVIDRSIAIPDRPPIPGPITDLNPLRPPVFGTEVGGGTVTEVGPTLPPTPVRRGAELDPRYSGQLQPPYPPSEQRAQRDGRVQVRVTIAPSGRVVSVERLMATSDAFWRVTEQQALSRWRFRPATLDGRPVQDSKVMTLIFRIVDAG